MTRAAAARLEPATAGRHVAWLAAGIVGGFLVPFVLADLLMLQRDVYYGLYIAFVVGLFVGWARDTGPTLGSLLARRWRWALGLGLLFVVVRGGCSAAYPESARSTQGRGAPRVNVVDTVERFHHETRRADHHPRD